MKRKPKIAPVRAPLAAAAILAPAAAPVAVATVSVREPWYRALWTDKDGEFDTGRILTISVIGALLYFEYVHVVVHGKDFNAQEFGAAVGAILVGLAAYLYGDAKRPPAPVPSTLTDIHQQQVTTP